MQILFRSFLFRAIPSALMFACLASAALADVKLDAAVGFDNTFRPESWIPVTISLGGTGVTGAGELQVIVSGREGTTSYSKPVRLHAGPLNEQHTIYYYHPSTAPAPVISAQLIVDGRRLAEKKLDKSFSLSETQPAIVALTQDRSGLNYLQKLDFGRQHMSPGSRQQWNQFQNGQPGNNTPLGNNPMRVLYPPSLTLPDSPFGYNAVDCVMLGDMPLDSLTEEQWNAIARWVKAGGELVISGGSDLNKLKNPQLAQLLPIVPKGIRQVTSLPKLEERYDEPLRMASTTVVVGSLNADSMATCTQGDIPLVSTKRIGTGTVVFTAFDLTSPEFRAWAGEPNLWQEILRLGTGEASARQVLRNAANRNWYDRNQSLADALAGIQASEAPGFTFIGMFLLLYIIVLVPVNYFILRMKDRKELAWITAPAIILGFSTAAYGIGYSVKGGQLFMRYATVIEGSANSDGYAAYTVASIFSPRQTRYNIGVSDPVALAGEANLETGFYQRQIADLSVESDKGTGVKDALVNMWDHRNFEFDSHVELGGSIAASAVPTQGGLSIHVKNNSGHALSDCLVSYHGQSQKIGSLVDGQERTVTLPSGGGPGTGRIGPVAMETQSDLKPGALAIKQALSTALTTAEGTVQGADPLLFTGWFSDVVTGLNLEHEKPVVEGLNILAVHIPSPSASIPVRPPKFIKPNPQNNPFQRSGMSNPFRTGGMMGGGQRVAVPTGSYALGVQQYGQKQYSAAEKSLRAAIKQNPKDAQSLNMLAYALIEQKKSDEALKTAKLALQYAPGDGTIMDTVGEMHQRRKEWKSAAEFYEKALARMSYATSGQTHEKYGETLLQLGKKDDAITHFRQALRDMGEWGRKARKKLNEMGVQ